MDDKFCETTIERERTLFFLFTCVKEGRKYITKLFDSLLKQTETNFVHYIYEDGSDDPIEDLVCTYKENAANLKAPFKVYYERNNTNVGLNKATKHCIDVCDLPYFIWIDCDNWVDERFFEELGRTARKNPRAIVIRSMFNMLDPTKKELIKYDGKDCLTNFYAKNQMRNFFFGRYIYTFFAVKKDFYLNINVGNYFIFDRNCFNDTQVLCHCIYSKKPFAFSENANGFYLLNRNGEGYTHKDDIGMSYENMIKTIAEHDDAWCKSFIGYIPSVRLIYNKMVVFYSQNNFIDSFSLYKELLRMKWKYKIPNNLTFGYGNSFTWYIRIKFKKLRCLFKKH